MPWFSRKNTVRLGKQLTRAEKIKASFAALFSLFKGKDEAHRLHYYPQGAPYMDLSPIKNKKAYLHSSYFPRYMAVAYVHLYPELYTLSYKAAKAQKKAHVALYRALTFDDAVERVYKRLMNEAKNAQKGNKAKTFTRNVLTAIKRQPAFEDHLTALQERRTQSFTQLESLYGACKGDDRPYYATQKEKDVLHKRYWEARAKAPVTALEEASAPILEDPTVSVTNTLEDLNTYQVQQARRAILLPFTNKIQTSAWNMLELEHGRAVAAQPDPAAEDASELLAEQKAYLTENGYFSEASSAKDLIEYARSINESMAFAEALKKDLPSAINRAKVEAGLTATMDPFIKGLLNRLHYFTTEGWAAWQSHTYIEEGQLARMGRMLSMQMLGYLQDAYTVMEENKQADAFHHFFNTINDETVKGFTHGINMLNRSEIFKFDLKFLHEENRPHREKPTYLELQQLLRFMRSYLPKDNPTQSIFLEVLGAIYGKDKHTFTPVQFEQKVDPQLLAVHIANSAAIEESSAEGLSREGQRKAIVKDTTFGDEKPGAQPRKYKARFLAPLLSLFNLLKFWKWPGWISEALSSEDKEKKAQPKKAAPRSPQLSKVEGITSASRLKKVMSKYERGEGYGPRYKLLPHSVRPYRERRFALFMPFTFNQDTEYEYIGLEEMLSDVKHWFGRWFYAFRGRPYYERVEPVALSLMTLIPDVLMGDVVTGKIKETKPGWWRRWLGGTKIWEFFQTADNVDTAAVVWAAYLHITKSLPKDAFRYCSGDESSPYGLDQLAKHLDFNTLFDFATLAKNTKNELRMARKKLHVGALRAALYFKRYEKALDKLMGDPTVLIKAVAMAEHIVQDMEVMLYKKENLKEGLQRHKVSTKQLERYAALFTLIEEEYIPAVKKQSTRRQRGAIKATLARFEKVKADFHKKRSVTYWIEQCVANKDHLVDKTVDLSLVNYQQTPLQQWLPMIELYGTSEQKPVARALVNFLLGMYRPENKEDYNAFIKSLDVLFKSDPKKEKLSKEEKKAKQAFCQLVAKNFIIPHVDENYGENCEENPWLLNKYAYAFAKYYLEKEEPQPVERWRKNRADLVQSRYDKVVQFLNSSAVRGVAHGYSCKSYHEQLHAFNEDIEFIERYGDDNSRLADLKAYIWSDLLFAAHYPVPKGALYAALQQRLQPDVGALDETLIAASIKKTKEQVAPFRSLLEQLGMNQSDFYEMSATGEEAAFEGAMDRIVAFAHDLCEKNEMARTTLQAGLEVLDKFREEKPFLEEELEAIEYAALVHGAGKVESQEPVAALYKAVIEKKEALKAKAIALAEASLVADDSNSNIQQLSEEVQALKEEALLRYHTLAEEVLLQELKRYFHLPCASLSLEAAYGACRFDYYTLEDDPAELSQKEIDFFRAQESNAVLRYLIKDKLTEQAEKRNRGFHPQWLYVAPLVGAFKDEALIDLFLRLLSDLDFSTLYDDEGRPTDVMTKLVKAILNSETESIIACFGAQWNAYLLQRQKAQIDKAGQGLADVQLEGEGGILAENFFTAAKENGRLTAIIKQHHQKAYPDFMADHMDHNYYVEGSEYKAGALARMAAWLGGEVQGQYVRAAMGSLLQRCVKAAENKGKCEDLQMIGGGKLHIAKRYGMFMESDQEAVQRGIDEALIAFMDSGQYVKVPMDFFFLLVQTYGSAKAQVHYHLAMMKRIFFKENPREATRLFNSYEGVICAITKKKESDVFQRLGIPLNPSLENAIRASVADAVNGLKASSNEVNGPLWSGVKEAMLKEVLPETLKQDGEIKPALQRLYRAWFYRISQHNDAFALSPLDEVHHQINARLLQPSRDLKSLIGEDSALINPFLEDTRVFLKESDDLILNETTHVFLGALLNDCIWQEKSNRKSEYRTLLYMRSLEKQIADALKTPPFTLVSERLAQLIASNTGNNAEIYGRSIERIKNYILQRYGELNGAYEDSHQRTRLDQFVAAINNTQCPQFTVPLQQGIDKIKKESEEKAGHLNRVRDLCHQLARVDNYQHVDILKRAYIPNADEHDVGGAVDKEREDYWKQRRQELYNYLEQKVSLICLPPPLRQEVQALVKGYQVEGNTVKKTYVLPESGSQLNLLAKVKNPQDVNGVISGYLQHNEGSYVRVLQQVVLPSLKNYFPQWDRIELSTDNARACAKYASREERTALLNRIITAAEYLAECDPLRKVLENFVSMVKWEVKTLAMEKKKTFLLKDEENQKNEVIKALVCHRNQLNTREKRKVYWNEEAFALCRELDALCKAFGHQSEALHGFFKENKQRYLLRLLRAGYGQGSPMQSLFQTMSSTLDALITFTLSTKANEEKQTALMTVMAALMELYQELGELPTLVENKRDIGSEEISLKDGRVFKRRELLIVMMKDLLNSKPAEHGIMEASHILYNLYSLLKIIAPEASHEADAHLLELFHRYVCAFCHGRYHKNEEDLSVDDMEILLLGVWPGKMKPLALLRKTAAEQLTEGVIDAQCALLANQGLSSEEIANVRQRLEARLPVNIHANTLDNVQQEAMKQGHKKGISFSSVEYKKAIIALEDRLFDSLAETLDIRCFNNELSRMAQYKKEIKLLFLDLVTQLHHYSNTRKIKKFTINADNINTLLLANNMEYCRVEGSGKMIKKAIPPAILKAIGLIADCSREDKQNHSSWINEGAYGARTLEAYFAMLYEIEKHKIAIHKENNHVKAKRRMQVVMMQILRLANRLNHETLKNNYYSQQEQPMAKFEALTGQAKGKISNFFFSKGEESKEKRDKRNAPQSLLGKINTVASVLKKEDPHSVEHKRRHPHVLFKKVYYLVKAFMNEDPYKSAYFENINLGLMDNFEVYSTGDGSLPKSAQKANEKLIVLSKQHYIALSKGIKRCMSEIGSEEEPISIYDFQQQINGNVEDSISDISGELGFDVSVDLSDGSSQGSSEEEEQLASLPLLEPLPDSPPDFLSHEPSTEPPFVNSASSFWSASVFENSGMSQEQIRLFKAYYGVNNKVEENHSTSQRHP